ncbi:MAG: hypothetical protein ACI9F2_000332 [Lysobacterales bacterium]|jgi:hypothetical protein
MKNYLVLLFVVLLTAGLFSTASAHGKEELKEASMTLVKSTGNLCASVKEEYNDAKFKPFGIIGGTLKGLIYTGKDFVGGIVAIVKVPLSHPHRY